MKRMLKNSSLLVLSASLLFPITPALANSYSTSAVTKAIAVAAAPADVKLSKEQALDQAKKLFSIPDDYQLDNTSFRAADKWRPFPEWSFNWVKKSANPDYGVSSIYVAIHADTGELTSYSSYSPMQSAPVNKVISRDAAQKIASDFIAKVAPIRAKDVQLYTKDVPVPKTPLGTNVVHFFRFVRMVNNVPFADNGIDISVDGSGKIFNYQLNWNDKIKFEESKPVSRDEALEAFRKAAVPKLSFIIPWEKMKPGDQDPPLLAYLNPFTFYLDAATKKPLTMGLNDLKDETAPVPVSEKPLEPLHKGEPLDQDSAVSYANKLFDLSGYQLQGANYNENDYRGGRPVWDLQFEKKDKTKDGRYLFISIDGQNGDVLNYSNEKRYNPAAIEKPKFTKEQGQEKAMEFMRKFSPTLASSFYLVDSMTDESKYQAEQGRMFFSFKRLVQGVPAASGDANISIDMNTGEVLYYYINIGKETYPDKIPDHKSAEQALEAYMKESDADLIYVLPPINDPVMEKAGEISERTAKLVYRMTLTPFDQPYVYDAVTGEWKNQANGKLANLHRSEPSDLKNHPAAKELGLMYEYDAVSLIDGKIMPDRPITRGEMIDMLMISLNQGRFYPDWLSSRKASYSDVAAGSRYFASVETAVNLGILDKTSPTLKPDEQITKEELADMIVRALGYKKLASYQSLFETKLTDVNNSKHRGAIAIVTALGIMTGEKNQFKPKASVSRADAAVAFYRFIEKRRELEENKFPN